MRTPRASSLNQATRIPASMACWPRASRVNALPVPEGPLTTKFSLRSIHSRGAQCLLSWAGDGGRCRVPCFEGLRGWEPGCCAAGGEHGPGPAGGFFGEERFDDLDRFPPLRAGGRDQVRASARACGIFRYSIRASRPAGGGGEAVLIELNHPAYS